MVGAQFTSLSDFLHPVDEMTSDSPTPTSFWFSQWKATSLFMNSGETALLLVLS